MLGKVVLVVEYLKFFIYWSHWCRTVYCTLYCGLWLFFSLSFLKIACIEEIQGTFQIEPSEYSPSFLAYTPVLVIFRTVESLGVASSLDFVSELQQLDNSSGKLYFDFILTKLWLRFWQKLIHGQVICNYRKLGYKLTRSFMFNTYESRNFQVSQCELIFFKEWPCIVMHAVFSVCMHCAEF